MPLNVLPDGHFALQSDQVTYVQLDARDAAGATVPLPAGITFTVTTAGAFAASLGATIGVMPPTATNPGAAAVVLTPLVLESDAGNAGGGISLVLTDSMGLPRFDTDLFDIVPDLAAVQVTLDNSLTDTTAQPAPAAPGP
jgi:hypothetical protein